MSAETRFLATILRSTWAVIARIIAIETIAASRRHAGLAMRQRFAAMGNYHVKDVVGARTIAPTSLSGRGVRRRPTRTDLVRNNHE